MAILGQMQRLWKQFLPTGAWTGALWQWVNSGLKTDTADILAKWGTGWDADMMLLYAYGRLVVRALQTRVLVTPALTYNSHAVSVNCADNFCYKIDPTGSQTAQKYCICATGDDSSVVRGVKDNGTPVEWGSVICYIEIGSEAIGVGDPVRLSAVRAGAVKKAVGPGSIVGFSLGTYGGSGDAAIELKLTPGAVLSSITGTYAVPTSITVQNGIITAIS
jgi:hypothetical protein